MNKYNRQRMLIVFFLVAILSTLFIMGGLKMKNAYGNTYLIPEDEIYKNIKEFSTSNTHNLYLWEFEGEQKLFVKGDNIYGQLGTKDYDSHNIITQILVSLPDSKITKVWALTNSSFILTEDGRVYASGNNNYGKLGIATEENTVNSFTEVMLPNETIGHIVDIQGNGNFTIFKTDIGRFYGAGDNTCGQLGLGESIEKVSDVNGDTVIEIATNIEDELGEHIIVKDIAAGKDFTVLIDDSQTGKVFFTGNNAGNLSNGAKQSATHFLPDFVYEFAFVTNVSQYDRCYFHNNDLSLHNFYIHASDEIYAVSNGMIISENFKDNALPLENYVVGEEIFPEIFLFSSYLTDIDVTYFQRAPSAPFEIFDSKSFNDILEGESDVDGLMYADFITSDTGDLQYPQSKSDFKLMNEGILFWFKSKYTEISYLSYFGKNEAGGANYIPWLENDGVLYIEEHRIDIESEKTTINKVSASQQTLLYSAVGDINKVFCESGNNTDGIITPLIELDAIDISLFNVMHTQLSNVGYPHYITDILPSATEFSVNVGEGETILFNSINRPNLIINASSKTPGQTATDIIDYEFIYSGDILKGIQINESLKNGVVTFVISDDAETPIELFEITVNSVGPTEYSLSFEGGANTVAIGETLDVVFMAPPEYVYGVNFGLRVNKNEVYDFTPPTLLGTLGGLNRYYTTINPTSITADTADLELWVLGADSQCVDSKTINITEPLITKIDIDFAFNMPLSIDIGDSIDVMQYVTPIEEASNMSYEIIEGNVFLRKITPSIGTFQGMSAGTATLRINHPNAIIYKDFNLIIKPNETDPVGEIFMINSPTSSINLKIGDSETINYSTTPSGHENKVTISSDDALICTVNQETKTIRATGAGTTYIRLTGEGATTPILIPVTVTSNIVIAVPETVTVKKGETIQTPVSVTPTEERKNIIFTANNLNIGVSQNGQITGIKTGTSIVTVLHSPTNTSRTILVTVISSNSNDDTPSSSKKPILTFRNTLNKKGELEIVLGGKVNLDAVIENYSGSATISFTAKDTSKVKIKDKTLEGIGVGKTSITISANIDVPSIVVDVNIVKASYADNEINFNVSQIKPEKEEKTNAIKKETLKQYERYKIAITGAKNIDFENCFDDYFVVKTDEKYISYLGNGVVRANYPGETSIRLYNYNGKTLIGKIEFIIPYPSDFFNKMPMAMGVPNGRTIRITFNQNILASSINPQSVFVQESKDGNGVNIENTVFVSKNTLNIKIPLSLEKTKNKTVYIFIMPEVKSTTYTSIFTPMVIPVTFVQ